MLMLVFGGLLVVSVSGCIANITSPIAWVSNTRLDVNDLKVGEYVITGEATSWVVLFGLVVWGNSGYEAALRDAKQKAGITVTEVYDVKTDRKLFNIFGLYIRSTTIITASVAQ
jgi:hypothetical protein